MIDILLHIYQYFTCPKKVSIAAGAGTKIPKDDEKLVDMAVLSVPLDKWRRTQRTASANISYYEVLLETVKTAAGDSWYNTLSLTPSQVVYKSYRANHSQTISRRYQEINDYFEAIEQAEIAEDQRKFQIRRQKSLNELRDIITRDV